MSETRVKRETRYQCPDCGSTISERAMLNLREAHASIIHSCLHCKRAAFIDFIKVEQVNTLVWGDDGLLDVGASSFQMIAMA